jgi:hypothetical protein
MKPRAQAFDADARSAKLDACAAQFGALGIKRFVPARNSASRISQRRSVSS